MGANLRGMLKLQIVLCRGKLSVNIGCESFPVRDLFFGTFWGILFWEKYLCAVRRPPSAIGPSASFFNFGLGLATSNLHVHLWWHANLIQMQSLPSEQNWTNVFRHYWISYFENDYWPSARMFCSFCADGDIFKESKKSTITLPPPPPPPLLKWTQAIASAAKELRKLVITCDSYTANTLDQGFLFGIDLWPRKIRRRGSGCSWMASVFCNFQDSFPLFAWTKS